MFADTITADLPDLARSLFDNTRMVRIHRDVAEHANMMAARDKNKIAKLARFTCWPDYDTWLEAEDSHGHFGIYFHGSEGKSVTEGFGLVTLKRHGDTQAIFLPVRFNLPKYELHYCNLKEVARMRADALNVDREIRHMFGLLDGGDFDPKPEPEDPIAVAAGMAPFLSHFKPLMFALLAFMNSPKLIHTREVDMARFNARRIKRGKYPYHPHHEVRLNIDKHDIKITQGQGDGPERALHFVRAHLRFLVHPRYKNVSVVLVPPHTRGNPELGIMKTSYAVDRENSRWVE